MGALRALALRSVALCVALVAGLGLTGGLIRLLPWILSPEVGWAPSLPFARLLLAAALEAAIMIGAPVGFAVGAALFVERGEFRALSALGASPFRVARSLSLPSLVLFLTALTSPRLAPTMPPGRFAQSVIDSARAECLNAPHRTELDIPLLESSWLCFPHQPRLTGALPGVPGGQFTAATVRLSDDARSAELTDVFVAARERGSTLSVHVDRASISGLPGWGSGKRLRGFSRGLVVGASAVLLAAFAAHRALTGNIGPIVAGIAAALGAIAAFQTLRFLDYRTGLGLVYVLVPGLGALVFSAVSTGARLWETWRIARLRAG